MQTVTDPVGDSSTPLVTSRDITKIWYARDAVNHYFRMDLVSAPAVNSAAGAYSMQISALALHRRRV